MQWSAFSEPQSPIILKKSVTELFFYRSFCLGESIRRYKEGEFCVDPGRYLGVQQADDLIPGLWRLRSYLQSGCGNHMWWNAFSESSRVAWIS